MIKRGITHLFLLILIINSIYAEEIFEEKETRIFNFDGKRIEVSVLIISEVEHSALLKANGKTFQLRPTETFETNEFVIILRDLIISEKASQKSLARIFISPKITTSLQTMHFQTGEYEIKGEPVNVNPYYYNILAEKSIEEIRPMPEITIIKEKPTQPKLLNVEEQKPIIKETPKSKLEIITPKEIKQEQPKEIQVKEPEKDLLYYILTILQVKFVLIVVALLIIIIVIKIKFIKEIKKGFKEAQNLIKKR